MKKLILLFIALSILLLGCEKKVEKTETPKEKKAVMKIKPAKAPLPKFSAFFSSLENLNIEDYNHALPEKIEDVEKKIFVVAFELGKLSADGVIATKARNKTKLISIAEKMIEYSKFIGIKQEILALADKIKTLIEAEKWNELELALDTYRTKVESALYASAEYDVFNLVQVGGWTEALYRITNLLNVEFDQKNTTIVSQKGTVNDLINNLQNFSSFKQEHFYNVTLNKYKEIKEIILDTEDGTYSKEQINKINSLAGNILENIK